MCSLISQQHYHPRVGNDFPRNKEQIGLHIAKNTQISKPTQLVLLGHQQISQANTVRRPTTTYTQQNKRFTSCDGEIQFLSHFGMSQLSLMVHILFYFIYFSYGDVTPYLFWRRMNHLSLMVHILFYFIYFTYGDVTPSLFLEEMSRLSLMTHILLILFILFYVCK